MADMDYNYNGGDVVSGVEPAKKRKGAVAGGITAGVLAVAVGGGVAAYNLSDLVKNQVKLTISKPANYYTWVTEKNTSELASQVAESYRTYLEEQKKGQTSEIAFKFALSNEASDMLSEAMAESGMEDTALSELKEVTLGVNSQVKDKAINGNIFAALNGENIINLDMAADYSAMEAFFKISGLSDQWILASNGEDTEDMIGASYSSLSTNLYDMESIITPDELESLVVKYVELYNSYISDVEIEKKEEIAIDDITVKYTVAEITLNEEKADEIAEGFINTLKEDELVKEILVDRTESMTAEEYDESLDEALDEINDDSEEDETILIKTYIDPKGDIRGMALADGESDEFEARFIMGQDEAEIRGEFVVTESGEDDVRMDIKLTESDDKAYSGSVSVTSEGETMSAEIKDLTVVDEKKGYMTGNISFEVEEQAISLGLGTADGKQTISSDIVVEDVNYGKLTIEVSSESGAEVSLPEKSDAYDLNGDEADFPSDYVEQDKMTAFAKDILVKIGLDEETADELAAEFADGIYNAYSFEDDWGYDDDLNGWDDEDFELDESDFEIDDEDLYWETATEAPDPYEDDIVIAEDGQAYLSVMDSSFMAMYTGNNDSLSYNAKVADINGNGTYTVSVTADTEGYKNATDGSMPEDIAMLGIEANGVKNAEKAKITIKSVKVDGKEYKVSVNPENESFDDYFSCVLYMNKDWAYEGLENSVDLSSIKEWTDIEITFEIAGL